MIPQLVCQLLFDEHYLSRKMGYSKCNNYAKKDIGSTSGIMFMNINIKDIYMHISDTFDDHFLKIR